MIEKINVAIEEMTDLLIKCELDSQDAMRFSQAIVNLVNARACWVQTGLNEEAAKNRVRQG